MEVFLVLDLTKCSVRLGTFCILLYTVHNVLIFLLFVWCSNGYGRSGTFIAIYNSTERLKVEQLIDVVQCVRAIRIAQPLAVDNIVSVVNLFFFFAIFLTFFFILFYGTGVLVNKAIY